jgi:hypothetical protein
MYWNRVPPKPRRNGLIVGVCVGVVVVLSIGIFGVSEALVSAEHRGGAAGTSGYTTFTGPSGLPLREAQPWGPVCQPIVFSVGKDVPADVYAQIVSVVNEARTAGLDVTVEDRSSNWRTDSLWYPLELQGDPATLQSAGIRTVGIFVNNGAYPLLNTGQPEHVGLTWTVVPDSDGQHDDLTGAQATLQMKTLAGDAAAQRHAMRYIVALTQGIAGSSRSDSGLKTGTTRDSFSKKDISAMKIMSGCDDAPDATVEHSPI